MVQEIFDSYIEHAFIDVKQDQDRLRALQENYGHLLPIAKDAAVLDIGIGRGEMLELLRRLNFIHAEGVDISRSTVKHCKELGYTCTLVEDTQLWLEQHPATFDFVSLLDVLEHIPKDNVVGFLRAVRRALKPKGRFIIQVPNLAAPDAQLHHFNDFTHLSGFIDHSLQQVLLTAGFKTFQFYGFVELPQEFFKRAIKRFCQNIYWTYVKFTRRISSNLNPPILNPVFFACVDL